MYIKTLILLLLGSNLILAHPAADEEDEAVTESSTLFNEGVSKIKDYWNSTMGAIENTLEKIKEQARYVAELAEKEYLCLKEKGIELINKTANAFDQEKQKRDQEIEKVKQTATETIDTIKHKVEVVNKQAEKAIEDILEGTENTSNQ